MLRISEFTNRIHKVETAIQPGEELVLDLVMHRERDLGAIGPKFGEIDQPHDFDVSASGFEGELLRALARRRQKTVCAWKPNGPRKLKSSVFEEVTVALVTMTNWRR